ncbi:hypothetical protein BUALT_Bualt06G0044500 [Buddleja alternifolia]|uniref:CCHC-type domain-containing protein n=1 Tax=Buddleja alternifolia TaxID=168488 RepID=A0AAV6XJG1_9LAMI|nr:hypothetical protein BUALT_Bualt06G0044500 [Buddleja alternifolia]
MADPIHDFGLHAGDGKWSTMIQLCYDGGSDIGNGDVSGLGASLNVGNPELTPQHIYEPANVFTIVGKILSDKKFNSGAVKSTILKAWNAKNHVDVNLVEDDKFIFVFQDKEDFSKVINYSPWSFRGNLFFLNHWPPEKVIEKVSLDHACFWIQVSNVPVMFINQENISLIGDTVGSFIMSDLTSEKQRWEKSFKTRVTIDLRKPLVDSVTLNPKPGVTINAEIRYERLADFCYSCGMLGHKLSTCTSSIIPSNSPSNKASALPFGPWLKAENTLSIKPTSLPSSSVYPAMKILKLPHSETLKIRHENYTSIPGQISDQKATATTTPTIPFAGSRLINPYCDVKGVPKITSNTTLSLNAPDFLQNTTQCMVHALNAQSKNNFTGPSSTIGPSKYVIPSRRSLLKPMFTETSPFQPSKRSLSDLNYSEPMKNSKKTKITLVDPKDYMDDLTLMQYNLESESLHLQSSHDHTSVHPFNQPNETLHSLSFVQTYDHDNLLPQDLEGRSLIVTEKRVTKWKRPGGVTRIVDMKILSWNCRGIAHPTTRRTLRALIIEHKPDVVFLCELKTSLLSSLSSLLDSLNLYSKHFVPPLGRSRGLGLAWNSHVELQITLDSKFHINALFTPKDNSPPWQITCVHGPCNHSAKLKFWDFLLAIGSSFGGPWLAIGDFNAVTSALEKKRGKSFVSSSNGGFKNILDEGGLVDLGFDGHPYTWSNKRDGWANIQLRLDRCVANTGWIGCFPRAFVSHLPMINSDHSLLLLTTDSEGFGGPKLFRFENMWIRYSSCQEVVKDSWLGKIRGSPSFILHSKIKCTRSSLRIWNRSRFGHCQRNISLTKNLIQSIQIKDKSIENHQVEKKLVDDLNELLKHEELMWRQRAKQK